MRLYLFSSGLEDEGYLFHPGCRAGGVQPLVVANVWELKELQRIDPCTVRRRNESDHEFIQQLLNRPHSLQCLKAGTILV